MSALRHVLWIGGAPGVGKTTVATRLARRHGLRWYSADARTWAHRDVALAAGHEAAARWEALRPEGRAAVLAEDPAKLLRLNLDLERGPMILADLRALPGSPLVVADGSSVLPELVAQGHADRARSVWLLPTTELLLERHAGRGQERLLPYRRLVAEAIERQAVEAGVQVLRLDGSLGIDETLGAVETLFADALAEGPLAVGVEERRLLLRFANEAVVEQARGFLARPWAEGDEATFRRQFLCECDDPECTEVVVLAVADYQPGVSAHP